MAEFTISLTAARINAGLTRTQVAAELGVSEGTVTNWELGRNMIPANMLMVLADVYKCPIGFFRLPDGSQNC